MHPLVVSRITGVNALGAGYAATREAILSMRTGLAPNDFTHLHVHTEFSPHGSGASARWNRAR